MSKHGDPKAHARGAEYRELLKDVLRKHDPLRKPLTLQQLERRLPIKKSTISYHLQLIYLEARSRDT